MSEKTTPLATCPGCGARVGTGAGLSAVLEHLEDEEGPWHRLVPTLELGLPAWMARRFA